MWQITTMRTRTRSREGQSWQHLYKTARWLKLRLIHLSAEPLCRMCRDEGRITPAKVVDHIKAHKGDPALFWDMGNLQALCAPHHNGVKQREERLGKRILPRGIDGWPIDDGSGKKN